MTGRPLMPMGVVHPNLSGFGYVKYTQTKEDNLNLDYLKNYARNFQ
jgi:hypothetical protein